MTATAPPENAAPPASRRRRGVPELVWSGLGVMTSLVFLAPLLAIAGESIGEGYRLLFEASFGSAADVGFLLVASTPLVLVGLGVALPLRAGLFNLGGEGQLLAGALAAVWLTTDLIPGAGGIPLSYLLPLLVAAVVGAIPGALAGWLRDWRNANEVVTTLMLSFIIVLLGQYLVSGPLQPAEAVYPATELVPLDFRLKVYGTDGMLPGGFIVAVLAAVLVWIYMEFTRAGWRQRMMGLDPRVALRQGINVGREGTVALALGGALAGMGGAAELLGNQFRVGYAFSPGWGFDAIVIALLARANAIAVIPFALYFGFLRNGAIVMQQDLQVSPDLVLAMGGAPVILVAAIIGYRAYRRYVDQPAEAE
jgi:simple sugar transport system permease protein